MDLYEAKRSNAKREALGLLEKFRKDPSLYKPKAGDLLRILSGPHSSGHPVDSGHRVLEIKYLLVAQNELSIMAVCECVGIKGSNLQILRRADPELDQMVRDYQAVFFEEEAMTGAKGLHPALTIFGLKSRADWIDAKDRAITMDQLAALAEQFMRVVKEELADHPDLIQRISDRFEGKPIEARVEEVR